ncbi:hypothetical protein chiPu_0016741 [Chiloscyllium punctatum]|uniref:Uncharacterized protein n=1 Tax=Chiloscyllium punctatum TaxID=137246 RepID=A0A401T6F2_CHIPU|nr:hypothetical protein [Chiloscyllium punctatum]
MTRRGDLCSSSADRVSRGQVEGVVSAPRAVGKASSAPGVGLDLQLKSCGVSASGRTFSKNRVWKSTERNPPRTNSARVCGCGVEGPQCGCGLEGPQCGCGLEGPQCGCGLEGPQCGCGVEDLQCGCGVEGPRCGCGVKGPQCGCGLEGPQCGCGLEGPQCGCGLEGPQCGCGVEDLQCGYGVEGAQCGYGGMRRSGFAVLKHTKRPVRIG